MSLKAKIEAVIYAAEEPVTLAQLAGLLGQEAGVELDRISSAQRTLALAPTHIGNPSPGYIDSDEANGNGSTAREENEPDLVALPAPADAPAVTEQVQEHDPKRLERDERERARALRDFLRALLDELIRDYARGDRGLEIREVAGGFRLATKPEYHDAVRGFVRSLKPPLKLSLQALETLAVVAYKQPVTAPEVSEIRGVDSGGVLGSLMTRKLVTTAGRKQVIGRPILYKTTKDFLLRFGLKDISELPSIEEFEKMAGELSDNEPVQEEIAMSRDGLEEDAEQIAELRPAKEGPEASITGADLEQERDATQAQADGDGATVESVTRDGRLPGVAHQPQSPANMAPSAVEGQIQQDQSNEPKE